jgi:hypothetical protein
LHDREASIQSGRRPDPQGAATIASVAADVPPFPPEFDGLVPPPISASWPPEAPWQNYFARHWRGELSLSISYWVNGFVAGLIGATVIAGFGSIVSARDDAQPLLWLVSLCSIWLCIGALTIWQSVGTWRSATNYRLDGKRFWGGLAKIMTVLSVAQTAFRFALAGMPQIAGMVEIVAGDSRVGPHQFRVLAQGELLEFSGGITFGVAKEMEGFLNAMTHVKAIRLNSIGGRILEAQKMSDLIKTRHLWTFVEKQCLSACTIVFLGGSDRIIMPKARIGFHQPMFRGMTAADRRLAIATEEQRLEGFGLSRAFAERANQAEPGSMWYPPADELLRERVVTRVLVAKPAAPKVTEPSTDTAAGKDAMAGQAIP